MTTTILVRDLDRALEDSYDYSQETADWQAELFGHEAVCPVCDTWFVVGHTPQTHAGYICCSQDHKHILIDELEVAINEIESTERNTTGQRYLFD